MSNKILSNLNIGNNSYEIDDAFARQKVEEVNNNLLKINPVYSTSGSVVSFDDGADNLPLDELIVDINPVQDLHGYDHPWIGGGGKNLFGLSDFTNTYFGVTYAYESLSGKLSTNGTCTAGAGTNVGEITVPEGTYTFSADFTNATGFAQIFLRDKTTNANVEEIRSDRPQRTVALNGTYYIRIAAQNGSVNSGYVNNIQLELGESKTDFAPYSNICPITGWTGANINKSGINIWDEETELGNVSSTTGAKFNANNRIRTKNYIPVVPGAQYKIVYPMTGTIGTVAFYDSGKNFVSALFPSANAVITAPSNAYYMLIGFVTGYGVTYNHDISINYPATDTAYHPYSGESVDISFPTEAGTVYGGSLDVLTGVLTVTHYGFDGGTVNWTKTASYAYGKFYVNTVPLAVYNVSKPTVISSAYKSAANSSASADGNYVWIRSYATTICQLRVKDDSKDDMTVEEFKAAMTGVQFVYELAEPITYQLTPHEVKTLLGQNNIFTDINSKNILVSYKASILKYIDRAKSTIFFGQCDPTSTSTKFTAQIDGITEYFDGLTILLKNGVVTSAAGCTFNINGLGEKGAWGSYDNAKLSTLFAASRSLIFIYDSTLDEGNGGFWWYQGKDSNDNTIGYAIRTNSKSLPVLSVLNRYRLLFTSADRTHYIPANNSNSTNTTSIRDVCQEKIDPFGDIVYYGTTSTIQSENRPAPSTLWLQNAFSLGYSFNRTGQALTLELWKPVYVKATPYVDGSAIIDADEPYVQDLPITDDGKIYIYLGVAYNTTSVELSLHHPIYYCYNGVIRPWLGFTDSEHAQDIVSSVNGKTGTVTLTAEDVGAMEGMTILSYGHSTWAEFLEAYEANRVVYCKASSAANPATGQQGRMAFLAYVQFKKDGYNTDRAEFQYYKSVSTHTDAQQGDQVFCYVLTSTNGGTWSVEIRQATSRVVAGTGLSSAYTTDKVTLSLDADYKNKIDTLWADYQSRIGQ